MVGFSFSRKFARAPVFGTDNKKMSINDILKRKSEKMSAQQYFSKYPVKTPIPPVLSAIERINLKNGCSIVPGTDGNIYGVTTLGTSVNLTSAYTADLTQIQADINTLQSSVASLNTLVTRTVALLNAITGVNVATQASV
jgi:hypothetical protein